jgi:uncharacterized protein (TIGR02284 family)
MQNEKAVTTLNKLIEINNDRIEGYQTASKETKEADLQALFADRIETSEQCKDELEEEVQSLNGKPTEGTKVSGKFFRAWMDVKAALTGKDRKVILESCEYGEDHAVSTYDEVIRDDKNFLTTGQLEMITEQREMIKQQHDEIKSLRDMLVEEKAGR